MQTLTVPSTAKERKLSRLTRGVVGHQPASAAERAMRGYRRELAEELASDNLPASTRRQVARVKRGVDMYIALGKRIGAFAKDLGKPERAGTIRAAERNVGEARPFRLVSGPSSNWTEKD